MGIEAKLLELRLRIEEKEDRARRNAVRIKGLIGDWGREGLMDTLTSLFHRLLAEGDKPALHQPR